MIENTYWFFDAGAAYSVDATLSITTNVFFSFWFKPVRTSNTLSKGQMVFMSGFFEVDYDRSIGSDDNKYSTSQVTLKQLSGATSSCSVLVPRHENVWRHAMGSIETTNSIMRLSIDGVYPFYYISNRHSNIVTAAAVALAQTAAKISIGAKSTTSYFTGFVREFFIASGVYSTYYSLLAQRRFVAIY